MTHVITLKKLINEEINHQEQSHPLHIHLFVSPTEDQFLYSLKIQYRSGHFNQTHKRVLLYYSAWKIDHTLLC
jgi:hypothetical protein